MSEGKKIQVEYWPVERLIPFFNNARTHSEEQVAAERGVELQP